MLSADGTPIRIIDSNESLAALLQNLRTRSCIAIDTEFVRTSTFYPKVGLLQLADETACYLVDPLKIDDWNPFRRLLLDSECVFIIHSGGEDLNLLQTAIGCVPARIFDTQRAAAFLGLGYSMSYQVLVQEVSGIEIPKGETRSDWLQRPLSEKQLHYAATDVCHLVALEQVLRGQLIARDLLEWFEQECDFQLAAAACMETPANWLSLYTRISKSWRLDDEGLGYLQRLCYWREKKARARDRPRNWILKDADLYAIAESCSESGEVSLAALSRAKQVNKKLVDRYGRELIQAMTDHGVDYPRIDRSLMNAPLAPAYRNILKSCQQVISQKAREMAMSPELLARKKLLLDLLRGYELSGELLWQGELAGWRRQVLEPEFTRILGEGSIGK